jgi:hypothetical protein
VIAQGIVPAPDLVRPDGRNGPCAQSKKCKRVEGSQAQGGLLPTGEAAPKEVIELGIPSTMKTTLKSFGLFRVVSPLLFAMFATQESRQELIEQPLKEIHSKSRKRSNRNNGLIFEGRGD